MGLLKILGTAFAALYLNSCSPSLNCKGSEDCKLGSTCVYDEKEGGAFCQDATGNRTEPASSESGSCGDSLLTGNFLWSASCHYGTSVPFTENPCQGYWNDKHGGFPITYFGMTLNTYKWNEECSYENNDGSGGDECELVQNPIVVHLRRDLTRADFKDFSTFEEWKAMGRASGEASFENFHYRDWLNRRDGHEVEIVIILCDLIKEENLYLMVLETEEQQDGIPTQRDFVLLTQSPWYDRDSCRDQIDTSWKEVCYAENPFPDACKYCICDESLDSTPSEECIAQMEVEYPF